MPLPANNQHLAASPVYFRLVLIIFTFKIPRGRIILAEAINNDMEFRSVVLVWFNVVLWWRDSQQFNQKEDNRSFV